MKSTSRVLPHFCRTECRLRGVGIS